MHLSNAFIQTGFVKESQIYIEKSLEYNPDNLFSEYLRGYIIYAKNRDLSETKDLLIKTYNKDLTRIDILQEIAKICYYIKDYQSAYNYYKKFVEIEKAQKLDIYRDQSAIIYMVYSKMGLTEEANEFLEEYEQFVDDDTSTYNNLSKATRHILHGENSKAIEQMKLFLEQDNYFYWVPLFYEIDPMMDDMKKDPEFKQLIEQIDAKFWKNHQEIRDRLDEKGLLSNLAD